MVAGHIDTYRIALLRGTLLCLALVLLALLFTVTDGTDHAGPAAGSRNLWR